MAGYLRIGRRATASDDRQCEGVEQGRVCCGVPRRRQRLGRGAGEALARLQFDGPNPARREQRIR